ncbi:MAG: hypothetical protein AAF609_00595 [Cyanobacteria bacterium P01_C01_bin.120]
MKLLAAPAFLIGLFISFSSALAGILELDNPAWEEVPGTADPLVDEQFSGSAYVDVNSLVDNGEILTFDMVGSAGDYVRMEVDCNTSEFRALRLGFFESQTRAEYREVNDPWQVASEGSYQGAVVSFVCSFSE